MSGTETQAAMPGATGPTSFILAFCEVFMSQPFNVPVISRYVSESGWCYHFVQEEILIELI